MGKIVELAGAQKRRSQVRSEMATLAPMHPALRWIAGEADRAHRRRADGHTACGEVGPLMLADPDSSYCPVCYPYWASVER